MIMCATPLKENGILCVYHRDHPYITSAKGLVGWGRKMAFFADVHSVVQCRIYADIVGGWVRKKLKIYVI